MLPDNTPRRFSRQQRLLKASEFKYVFSRPLKVGNAYLSVLARPNGLKHARLGMTVPKRQVAKAVARNRIKRLVRESFRYSQLRREGLDVVVLVRSGAQIVDNATLNVELNKQWDRLKKKCEKSS